MRKCPKMISIESAYLVLCLELRLAFKHECIFELLEYFLLGFPLFFVNTLLEKNDKPHSCRRISKRFCGASLWCHLQKNLCPISHNHRNAGLFSFFMVNAKCNEVASLYSYWLNDSASILKPLCANITYLNITHNAHCTKKETQMQAIYKKRTLVSSCSLFDYFRQRRDKARQRMP